MTTGFGDVGEVERRGAVGVTAGCGNFGEVDTGGEVGVTAGLGGSDVSASEVGGICVGRPLANVTVAGAEAGVPGGSAFAGVPLFAAAGPTSTTATSGTVPLRCCQGSETPGIPSPTSSNCRLRTTMCTSNEATTASTSRRCSLRISFERSR